MSYCRFGDNSDVYLYPSVLRETIICCSCRLHPKKYWSGVLHHTVDGFADISLDAETALEHLSKHRTAGHKVPEYAFDRLKLEIK